MDLVQQLINRGYLKTPRIITAFQKIKRQDFILPEFQNEAEADYPLSIGCGQTISQPATVAFMLEQLQPQSDDKVLDIGSGSGWTTALLAEIVGPEGKVYGMERIVELKEFGENNTRKYNFVESGRAVFVTGDGSKGLVDFAPFDKIHVGAAAAKIPNDLLNQLAIGGRMIIPEGIDWQEMVIIDRKGANDYQEKRFPGFIFVPLISDH